VQKFLVNRLDFENVTLMSVYIHKIHLIEVHNLRRPLDRLTLTATLTFDLICIGGRGIVIDSLCGKFGDFSFSRFAFIVRTVGQNHRQNHRQTDRGG